MLPPIEDRRIMLWYVNTRYSRGGFRSRDHVAREAERSLPGNIVRDRALEVEMVVGHRNVWATPGTHGHCDTDGLWHMISNPKQEGGYQHSFRFRSAGDPSPAVPSAHRRQLEACRLDTSCSNYTLEAHGEP